MSDAGAGLSTGGVIRNDASREAGDAARLPAVPHGPCCAPCWHRISVWLFRLSIPVIVVACLVSMAISVKMLVDTWIYMHEPHPGDDAYALMGVLYFLFGPLLLIAAAQACVVVACGVSMRREFWPLCPPRHASYEAGAVIDATTGTPAAEVAAWEMSDVAGSVHELPVEVKVERGGKGCLHRGTCRFCAHVVFILFCVVVYTVVVVFTVDITTAEPICVVHGVVAFFSHVYMVALVMHCASASGWRC